MTYDSKFSFILNFFLIFLWYQILNLSFTFPQLSLLNLSISLHPPQIPIRIPHNNVFRTKFHCDHCNRRTKIFCRVNSSSISKIRFFKPSRVIYALVRWETKTREHQKYISLCLDSYRFACLFRREEFYDVLVLILCNNCKWVGREIKL